MNIFMLEAIPADILILMTMAEGALLPLMKVHDDFGDDISH